jgi:cytochrome P450
MASSRVPTAENSVVSPTPDDTVLQLPLPSELLQRGRCPFDPPKALDRIRVQSAVSPVTLRNGRTAWLITGFDQTRAVLSDPRFSADRLRHGSLLSDVPNELRKQLLDKRLRAGSFISMDPPSAAATASCSQARLRCGGCNSSPRASQRSSPNTSMRC